MAKTQALKGDTACPKGVLSIDIVNDKKGGLQEGKRELRGEGGREKERRETSSLRIQVYSVT